MPWLAAEAGATVQGFLEAEEGDNLDGAAVAPPRSFGAISGFGIFCLHVKSVTLPAETWQYRSFYPVCLTCTEARLLPHCARFGCVVSMSTWLLIRAKDEQKSVDRDWTEIRAHVCTRCKSMRGIHRSEMYTSGKKCSNVRGRIQVWWMPSTQESRQHRAVIKSRKKSKSSSQ